jgi:hypothetical protein
MSLKYGHQRAYCSSSRWYKSMECHGGIILTEENRRTWIVTCPNATLSTTNPTQIYPNPKPGLRWERPATNRLSHNMALLFQLSALRVIGLHNFTWIWNLTFQIGQVFIFVIVFFFNLVYLQFIGYFSTVDKFLKLPQINYMFEAKVILSYLQLLPDYFI